MDLTSKDPKDKASVKASKCREEFLIKIRTDSTGFFAPIIICPVNVCYAVCEKWSATLDRSWNTPGKFRGLSGLMVSTDLNTKCHISTKLLEKKW